jgi:hypothetical protein
MHAAAAISFFALGGVAQDVTDLMNLGVVMCLVGLLADENPDPTREAAAHALGNLAQASEPCRRAAADNGAVQASVSLLKSDTEPLLIQALWLLHGLLTLPEASAEFARIGGLASLTRLTERPKTREAAVALIVQLSSANPAALEAYVQAAGVGALLGLIASTNAEAQTRAAELLARIAADSERRRDVVAADGVPAVVALLISVAGGSPKAVPVLRSAVSALSSLSQMPEAR